MNPDQLPDHDDAGTLTLLVALSESPGYKMLHARIEAGITENLTLLARQMPESSTQYYRGEIVGLQAAIETLPKWIDALRKEAALHRAEVRDREVRREIDASQTQFA